MSEQLSRDDVARVARLARLTLTEAELDQYAEQLGSILEYVQDLADLDIDDVQPMAHAVESRNVFREDVARESLPREEAVSNAPATDGEYFLVPPILQSAKDADS